jgi:hypothetical protein
MVFFGTGFPARKASTASNAVGPSRGLHSTERFSFPAMPRFAASETIDYVSAVRQALSAPICENPTTSLPAACDVIVMASSPKTEKRRRNFITESIS